MMRSVLAIGALLLAVPMSVGAQSFVSQTLSQTRTLIETNKPDVAVSYQYMRSNTQPGACGCFALNGAGLSASWRLPYRLTAVAEGDLDFASDGPGTGNSMTLFSGLGGARYALPVHVPIPHAPQLFAEAMGGFGHAGGGIAGAADGSFGFVGRLGGGFDEVVAEPFAARFEVAYEPTTFANGANNHQNNLLISVGFVFRWSRLGKPVGN
jgi:outer membrane immunogenic protein